MRMTDRGRETRAGKRKTTINRRRTKDAAKELPKRCDTYPRILWPTEVKLKLLTKPDVVTKKGEGLHQETFTILITIVIAVMMTASNTTTIPSRNHMKAGGFFFSGGGSSTTICG